MESSMAHPFRVQRGLPVYRMPPNVREPVRPFTRLGGTATVTVRPTSDVPGYQPCGSSPARLGKGHGSEAGRGVGAAGETPTRGSS